jgi:hypothetical protein
MNGKLSIGVCFGCSRPMPPSGWRSPRWPQVWVRRQGDMTIMIEDNGPSSYEARYGVHIEENRGNSFFGAKTKEAAMALAKKAFKGEALP